MDMNNGGGIAWESGQCWVEGEQRGKTWDNSNSIINKYKLKQKLKPKNQATGWEETICNTYTWLMNCNQNI